MKPTVEIYTSGPVSGAEAAALTGLIEALSGRSEPALILSNFTCGKTKRQVDILVVTPSHAAHLELKHFIGPIEGKDTGGWYYLMGGNRVRIPSQDGSPLEQATQTKYAISDEMEEFAGKNSDVPPPGAGKYYKQLNSAVCVYPRIPRGSVLTRGDHKVRVWSFENCLTLLAAERARNPWPIEVWRRFAAEHLRLDRVALQAAISSEVYEALIQLDALRSKQAASFAKIVDGTIGLGPELPADEHLLILGRKGIGKTILACRLGQQGHEQGKLCLYLRGMHYQGDFGKLLSRAMAPFSPCSVKDLVQTAETCAVPLVVLLDGVDQVADKFRDELLEGVAAFFERHPCTVIITSSVPVMIPVNIRGSTVQLPELSAEDRQKIYAHFAPGGTQLADLSAFPTPQDLRVAAECAADLAADTTPGAVYNSYVREQLGIDIAAVGTKVCRRVAHHVLKQMTPFLPHEVFYTIVEDVLAEAGAPTVLVDRIKNTRLFEVETDGISFTHDLLMNHLAAADVVAERHGSPQTLAEILSQPLYQQIAGEIISRIAEPQTATALILQFPERKLFESAFKGELGAAVYDRFAQFLSEVLQRAEEELDSFQLDCVVPDDQQNSPRVRPLAPGPTSVADLCGLELITGNLDVYFQRVVEILDRYGTTLAQAIDTLARTRRLRRTVLTTLYLQQEINCSSQTLRCSHLAHLLGGHSFSRPEMTPAVAAGFDQAFGGRANVNPITDYVLCGVWEHNSNPDVSKMLALFRKCWESNIYHLQLRAAEMLNLNLGDIMEHAQDRVPEVVQEVESRLSNDNPFLNTALFEILSRLPGFESPVSRESAEEEVHSLIAELRENSPDTQDELGKTLAERAYNFLSKIFEEIFAESYWQVYDDLSREDKVTLLNAGASDTSPGSEYDKDWILGELVKLAHGSSVEVFRHFCRSAPGRAFQLGQNVKLFLASTIGLARIGASLPEWLDGDASPQIAWKTIREIFYRELTGNGPSSEPLWQHLESEDPLGGVSVLLQSRYYLTQLCRNEPVRFHPEEHSRNSVKRLLEIGLKNWSRLDLGELEMGLFSHNPFGMACDILARIGDSATVALLETFTGDQRKGSDAIRTIRLIRERLRGRGTS